MPQPESKISINKISKGKLPSLPFSVMKNAILGRNYELSIVTVPAKLSRTLNGHYRGKDEATDILSFPLNSGSGELIINLPVARKKAKLAGRDFKKYLGFLFIHGMLHLKGMRHSSKMESKERQYARRFGFN